MTDELIKIEHLKRIDVQPGDRFVLTTPQNLSAQQLGHIKELWDKFIGSDDVPILMLPEGFELGVLRQEEKPAC